MFRRDRSPVPHRAGMAQLPPAVFLIAACLLSSCREPSTGGWTASEYRRAATALYEQGLYREAVDTYAQYLSSPALRDEDAPKVLFQMGNILLEDLRSPKEALARYAVLKALYPQADFQKQLGKNMVAAMEQMGRSRDAHRAMADLTTLSPRDHADTGSLGTKVVARIEEDDITLNQVRQALGGLPEKEGDVLQAVRQYVSTRLLADAARRKGLQESETIRLRLAGIEDQILAQATLEDALETPKPSPKDLQYYYDAHKDRYTGEDSIVIPIEQALERVRLDWTREKQAEAYQNYIQELLQASKVRFFDVVGGS